MRANTVGCLRLGTRGDRRFVGSHGVGSATTGDYNSALSASSRANASLPGRVADPTRPLPAAELCHLDHSERSRASDAVAFPPNPYHCFLSKHIFAPLSDSHRSTIVNHWIFVSDSDSDLRKMRVCGVWKWRAVGRVKLARFRRSDLLIKILKIIVEEH